MNTARLVWAVTFIAAGILGFEIALMRIWLVASWHHFAFLVISIALLGFGASGTVLCFLRNWLVARQRGALFALACAAAVSVPVMSATAQRISVESQFPPSMLWPQLGRWVLLWGLLFIPFLLGATVIGLGLIAAGRSVAMVYAGNLIGSGVGALAAPLVMSLVAPPWLPLAMAVPLFAGTVVLAPMRGRTVAGLLAAAAAIGAWTWADPPVIRPDPVKFKARLQQWARQGSARRVAVAYSPRAVVERYRSDLLHDIPFLGLGAAPPPIDVIAIDGHLAGSVLRINEPSQAAFLDNTLMTFAYALAPARPRVLLLGETGTVNTWLAVRHQPTAVDVVQPDPNVTRLSTMTDGRVTSWPAVNMINAQPRHFVSHTANRYDLIELVQLQSPAVGSAGMAGLAENHMVTVQGIARCLDRLSEQGLVSVSRGIQTPPRDNVKLLATVVEALRRRGIAQPQLHIAIVRDFLAVCTVVSASPWTPQQIEQMRRLCDQRHLTPVWFPTIRSDELNAPDELPAGPDGVGDWYYHAATQLFSPGSQKFLDAWQFDIRPPTDDRPFFLDFSKLKSIPAMRQAFGDLWLVHSELAYLFVIVAAMAIAAVGGLLTVVPLLFTSSVRAAAGRGATAAYFTAIGLAYLLAEMTVLSRLTFLIGDPVRAAALTIGSFLVISGLGSMAAHRLGEKLAANMGRLLAGLVVIALAVMTVLSVVGETAGGWPLAGRAAVAVAAIAPMAFLMGLPMPAALARLQHAAPLLVPWAWAVNGFASVLAAPLATAIAMTWGYTHAAGAALLCYLLAAFLFKRLPCAPSVQRAASKG